ncbi:hypothetical protein HNY73_013205 [Argiope bruennichi]|uniref:Uncharacterized protein n=1 Tax=Argiope bruennichi TaxID=94029 RepID=A0A8T0F374_ARGBR|nr:hypothetical protein HNY73_013205 [Argiope bruennichi]
MLTTVFDLPILIAIARLLSPVEDKASICPLSRSVNFLPFAIFTKITNTSKQRMTNMKIAVLSQASSYNGNSNPPPEPNPPRIVTRLNSAEVNNTSPRKSDVPAHANRPSLSRVTLVPSRGLGDSWKQKRTELNPPLPVKMNPWGGSTDLRADPSGVPRKEFGNRKYFSSCQKSEENGFLLSGFG